MELQEQNLNLNEYLIHNQTATFFLRVAGDSMSGAGIFPGDILIVDRSEIAVHGSVIIAALNGELVVKRFVQADEACYLISENTKYPPIKVTEAMNFDIWGVVTYSLHTVKKR